MLAWGIIIGAIVVMYVLPVLDYFIIFNISVWKAKIQYKLQEEFNPPQQYTKKNAIGFVCSEEELEEDDDDYEFGSIEIRG